MWEMLPVAMTVIGAVFSGTGSIMAGNAAALQGQRTRQASEFEAQQMEQQSGQVFASSQRAALEQERQGKLVESRILALAAEGGAGAGAGAMDIIANVHAEAAYRSSVALYQGEEQQRKLIMGGQAKRFEGYLAEEAGRAKQTAGYVSAAGSLLKGSASLYDRYGGGGPSPANVGTDTSDTNWDKF